MQNTLTNDELKRRGMAAIEEGLEHGPLHIYKRNRLAAVVLSERDYERLVATEDQTAPGLTAAQWLLAYQSAGTLSKREIDRRVADERNW